MYTDYIWKIADGCVERGFFPHMEGRRFVLGLFITGGERAIIHRAHVNFRLHTPCRVWLISGKVRCFLGDSSALPGDLDCGVRPPYTG